MPTWFFRPVKRDQATPTGAPGPRDIRSKTVGMGATGPVKRGNVFADRLVRTFRPYKRG